MEQATSLLYDLDGFTVAGVTVNPLGSGCWSWSVCRCRAARQQESWFHRQFLSSLLRDWSNLA